jgi:hypothetical protein
LKHLTLDRQSNDGNYQPGNVAWTTREFQQNHRRNNVYEVFDGKTLTMAQWARHFNLTPDKLYYRMHSKGMTFAEALADLGVVFNATVA